MKPTEDLLLITRNANVADFEVAYVPVDQLGLGEWTPALTSRASEQILGVDAFHNFVVISMRSRGQSQLWSVLRTGAHGPLSTVG